MIRVREVGDSDECWTEVHDEPFVLDDEDAAAEACERWHSHGRWAGEKMPDKIECEVDFDGTRSVVTVHVDWSPSFTGCAS